MPSYFYRARDTLGRAHEGIEVAASEDEVLRALSQMQLTPVLIEARGQAAVPLRRRARRARSRHRPRRGRGRSACCRTASSRGRSRCSRASSPP
jgi:type II secretory pathway component PulF